MDINTNAISFIKEYNITDLNYEKLNSIISECGYTLIEYNLLFNDEFVNEIIQSLNLEDVLREKQSATFANEAVKYVFLRKNLSKNDKITLLLHEIGHIYLEHITYNVIINDVKYEREANEFAILVLQLIEKRKSRKKQLSILLDVAIVLCVLALIVSVILVIIDFTSESSESSDDFNNISSINESSSVISIEMNENDTSYIEDSSSAIETTSPTTTTTTTTATTTTTTTTTQETTPAVQDDNIFYITSSGDKYHREWCTVIQNKTNIFYGTKQDLENMGYEPCHLCIGE